MAILAAAAAAWLLGSPTWVGASRLQGQEDLTEQIEIRAAPPEAEQHRAFSPRSTAELETSVQLQAKPTAAVASTAPLEGKGGVLLEEVVPYTDPNAADKPVPKRNTDMAVNFPIMDWIFILEGNFSAENISKMCNQKLGEESPCGLMSRGKVPFIQVQGSEGMVQNWLKGDAMKYLWETGFLEPNFQVQGLSENAVPDHAQVTADSWELMNTDDTKGLKSWSLDRVGVPLETNSGEGVHLYDLATKSREDLSAIFDGRPPRLETVHLENPVMGAATTSTSWQEDREVNSYGTTTAAIAAGVGYGVASKAFVRMTQALSPAGKGYVSKVLDTLDWVAKYGERPAVVTLSIQLAGNTQNKVDAMQIGIDAATTAGVTVVVAAGNENQDACESPVAYVASAVTVGATNVMDQRSSFSNYGSCVQYWAPGSYINTVDGLGQEVLMSSTGAAAAIVTGAIALLLHENPSLTPVQVKEALGRKVDNDIYYLNASHSHNLVLVGDTEAATDWTKKPSQRPPPQTWETCRDWHSNGPDVANGDCMCVEGYWCYTAGEPGCQWYSVLGPSSRVYRSQCKDCSCDPVAPPTTTSTPLPGGSTTTTKKILDHGLNGGATKLGGSLTTAMLPLLAAAMRLM